MTTIINKNELKVFLNDELAFLKDWRDTLREFYETTDGKSNFVVAELLTKSQKRFEEVLKKLKGVQYGN